MTDLRAYDKHLYGNPQTAAKPKVSVCFITYNHARYIRQALDSIVSQQTDFEYEVVIGDDCSTDGTSAIVREFADKYPQKVRAYIHHENLSQFGLPGKLNFVHAFSVCRGEYIVHVEGDDYFTDPQKLQKQADFLDTHQQYSACWHNALMKFEDNSGRQDYPINPPDQQQEIRPSDLLQEREIWFMGTAAVMFRRALIGDAFPAWFHESKSGDIPLYVMLSHINPIAYFSSEIMSVYRRHTAGLSYTDSNYDRVFIENRILMYQLVDTHTQGQYRAQIRPIIGDYYWLMLQARQLEHSQKEKLKFFLKGWQYRNYRIENPKSFIFNKVLTENNRNKWRQWFGG